MDFHAAMETFAEAWVAANTQTPLTSVPDDSPQSQPVCSDGSENTPAVGNGEARVVHLPVNKGSQRPKLGLLDTINQAVTPTTSTGPGGVKSMPIHCIVEQVQSLAGGTADGPTNGKLGITSTPGAKNNLNNSSNPVVEMDTYAILPGTTMFSELVRTALIKIGYTASEAIGAKGAIQIKQWKPLTFDTITENPNCTLDEILGDLTSIATLRIRLCRTVTMRYSKFGISQEKLEAFRSLDIGNADNNIQWTDELVRCAVVELLNEMNQKQLAKLSPLAQSTISNIANSKYFATLSLDKCAEFGRWFTEHQRSKSPDPNISQDSLGGIRVTFHPIYELPKMRSWFSTYPNPNDALFESLVDELNTSNVRQQRKMVSPKKLKIWWRNEKVRQKRIIRRIERGEDVIKSGRGRKRKDNIVAGGGDITENHASQESSFTERSSAANVCHGHNPDANMLDMDRSPSMGSPVRHDLSPVDLNVSSSSSLPTPNPEHRPYHAVNTVDRGIFQQPPVYPVPYLSLTPNSIHHDGNISRGGGGHLEMLSPHSPPAVSRYFSSPRRDDQDKMMLPLKNQPIVYQHHHSPYGN